MRPSIRLVPVGFLLAAACASSTGPGTGPGSADLLLNEAVASMAGEGAAQHVEMMRGPGGPHGFGFPADPSKFECTNSSHDGLTVTRHCLFEDISNELQEGYDPVTTETVIQDVEVNGTLDRGHIGGTIHRVSLLQVSGLSGSETSMTWYGTSTETSTRVHQAEDGLRQMDMSSADTIKQVVIPVPRTETSWPKSGTISRNVTVTFTGGPKNGTTEQRAATISFDGTQFATVTVNGDTFKFDLAGRGKPEHRAGDGMRRP